LKGQDSLFTKKFNQDLFWTFGSFGILAVSGIVVNIVIVSFYGTGALGVFNQVFALYIVLSQFSVGGIQFSVLKEISHNYKNRQDCAEILASALVLTSLIAGVVCLICFSCRNLVEDFFASPEVAAGFVLVIPGLFWFSLNKVLIMALNGFRLMKSYAFFQALRYLLILVIILILLVLQYEPSFLLISLTVTEVILFLLLFSYLHFKVYNFKFNACTLVRIRRHFFYGVKGFFSGVLLELNTRLDVIMLGFFLSDSSVGIYSFAAMLAEGFSQIPQVLRRNVDPLLGRCFASDRIKEIEEIAQKMKKLIWPFMGGVTILAISLYPLLVKMISSPGEDLLKSWGVFSIIMFGILLNAGYKPLIGVFLQGGQPGIHTLFTLWIVASNGLLNLLLIPYWGIYGAAFATSLVFVIEAIAIVFYAKRQFNISLLGFSSS
jgi:O-antigen/teichoic acid export membrane protein